MTRRSTWWLAVMWVGAMSAPAPARAAEGLTPAVVVCPTGKQGSFAERLAAQEIRRYYYLRTGRLVPVAEGLESAEQVEALTLIGYQVGQGYHLARPMPATEVDTWLTDHCGGPGAAVRTPSATRTARG